eukprot:m.224641 g.224641  ORF g.224641 m.224641 type:complete len:696 (-) comp16518_c0_seq1:156-2243(-)
MAIKPFVLVLVVFLPGLLAIPPAEWQARVDGSQMLYTDDDSKVKFLPSVGNGFSAFVIDSDSLYIAGIFNGEATKAPSHRARVPSPLSYAVRGGDPARPAALDIERGIYFRRTTFGSSGFVEQRWYVHQAIPSLVVMELEARLSGSAPITFSLQNLSGAPSGDIAFTSTRDSSSVTMVGQINAPEISGGVRPSVAVVVSLVPGAPVTATANTTWVFVAAIHTSIEASDPVASARADFAAAMSKGPQRSLHEAAWLTLWASGVEIAGRPDVARAVNTSFFYILSSIREERPFSLSPGGLASNAYNGHTFWDCETWMYPSVLLLQPRLAASLLQYRFDRIIEAHEKAQSYPQRYNGAMFPWESAFTGVETCPTWAGTGLREQHISGDIAFAVQQYFRLTGNTTWLHDFGYPLLQGIAEFWVSRVQPDPKTFPKAALSINDVIPPDEYHDHVNDSVYTNVVARIALEAAADAARVLGLTPDPIWEDVAARIVVLFDEEQNFHPEYKGYHNETIKQADVVLLGYPLGYNMSADVRRNDLLYYAKVTSNDGPAMTWGMHAIGFVDLGDRATAAGLFNRSFANTQAPFDVWTETPSGGAVNFLTGAGGFLQTVTFGYPGIRITGAGLTIKPALPEGATRMVVRSFSFQGSTSTLDYNSATMTLTVLSMPVPLCLDSATTRTHLTAGQSYVQPIGAYTMLRC